MENHKFKPSYYDLPLYMRIFPLFRNEEFSESPRKRDAFEDFIALYSICAAFGFIRPATGYFSPYI